MFYCTKCSRQFTTHWGVYAHTRCYLFNPSKDTLEDFQETIDWENVNDVYDHGVHDEEMVEFENIFTDLQDECLQYLRTQQETLSTEMIRLLEVGYPKLLNKSRKVQANIVVYFEIANFVNNLLALTSSKADSLLAMIKKVTHIFGKQIPFQ